jgi:tight adherence protein C
MFNGEIMLYLIAFCGFLLVVSFLTFLQSIVIGKRARLLERLHASHVNQAPHSEDILDRPLLDRTVGFLARELVSAISQRTPQQARSVIDNKLEKAGDPYNLKSGDFIAIQVILGITTWGVTFFLLNLIKVSPGIQYLLSCTLALLMAYIPWFMLAVIATKRQREIKRSLPDIMDLLVVSVEAGLAFDMALTKIVDTYQGTVALEFHRALREMQVGRSRKEALKDMSERVNLPELSSLVNAIIQSEQLGVGLGKVLRIQSDLIREKRQQWIEEQAMKAPVKMLFPLVFGIFPSIFIVILGPAVLNILKMLNK